MEVTLDKIELVRDRTGVSYKEAKDALEAADGSVVDAIIAIEESMDGGVAKSTVEKKDALVNKMKEIVAKGNVSKIRVTRSDGETLLNIPLVAGVLGTVLAPWGVIAGTVAAFGFKCKIEFVKEDGSVVDISEKAGDVYDAAKEKGSDIVFEVKERAPGVYSELKERAPESFDELKNKASEAFNEFKEKAPGNFEELKAKGEEAWNKAKDTAQAAAQKIRKEADELGEDLEDFDLQESKEELFSKMKEMSDNLENKAADIAESAESELEQLQKEAAQGIKDFEDKVDEL